MIIVFNGIEYRWLVLLKTCHITDIVEFEINIQHIIEKHGLYYTIAFCGMIR